MTPELLSQLGIYADPNDPFSELPPEAQAAVIQQFVDQQQQQHTAILQGHHPGKPASTCRDALGVPQGCLRSCCSHKLKRWRRL